MFERTATEPVRIGDVTVEPGQRIAALLGAAHRDPAVFADPDTFRPDRDPASCTFDQLDTPLNYDLFDVLEDASDGKRK